MAEETRDFILHGSRSGNLPKSKKKKKNQDVVIQETVTRRITSSKPKGSNATTNKKKSRKNMLSSTQSQEFFIPMQYNSMVKNLKHGRRAPSSRNDIDLDLDKNSDQKVLSLNIGRQEFLKPVPETTKNRNGAKSLYKDLYTAVN